MLCSSVRHQIISGWLKENNPAAFDDALKLQKFLFFYELSKKSDGDSDVDFSHLRGYKNGPVFSNVYGDYRHEKQLFCDKVSDIYRENKPSVDKKRALQSSFMVSIVDDEELSAYTHGFEVWNNKKERIDSGEKQVLLDPEDISDADLCRINEALNNYSEDLIIDSVIIPKGVLKFVFTKEDGEKLTPDQEGILEDVACKYEDRLENPVYVTIAEDGALEFD